MDLKKQAREHLLAAEKYLKDSHFDEARNEVERAQELDPSNVYTFAFLERIEFFREQRAKEMADTAAHKSTNGVEEEHSKPDSPESIETFTGDIKEDQTDVTSDQPLSGEKSALDEIERFKIQLSRFTKQLEEFDSNNYLIQIVEKVARLEDKVNSIKDNLSIQYEHSESQPASLENIREVDEEVKSLREYINSTLEPVVNGNNSDTRLEPKIEDIESLILGLENIVNSEEDTYSDDEVNNKLSEIERQFTQLSDSIQTEQEIGKDFKRIETILDTLSEKVEGIAKEEFANHERTQIQQQFENLSRRLDTLQESIQTTEDIEKKTGEIYSSLQKLENELQQVTNRIHDTPNSDAIADIYNNINDIRSQLERSLEEIKENEIDSREYEKRDAVESVTQKLTDETQKQLIDLEQKLEKYQELYTRIDDLGDSNQHLHNNYADLEQRLQEFITNTESRSITRDELDIIQSELSELRKQIDEISGSTIREHELHQTQAEILSLYTDLEHRFNELIKKQDEQREELAATFRERQETLESQIASLQDNTNAGDSESDQKIAQLTENLENLKNNIEQLHTSQIDKGEIDTQFGQIDSKIEEVLQAFEKQKEINEETANVKDAIAAIYQQIDEIIETLHFENELRSKQTDIEQKVSDMAQKLDSLQSELSSAHSERKQLEQMERNFHDLKERYENDQQKYQTKLQEMSSLIEQLNEKFESESQKREEQRKRHYELGLKHFKSSVVKAWEHGVPSEEQAAELQNLVEIFEIPEDVIDNIIAEVKQEMYSRAVKKADWERKVLNKETDSQEELKKRFGIPQGESGTDPSETSKKSSEELNRDNEQVNTEGNQDVDGEDTAPDIPSENLQEKEVTSNYPDEDHASPFVEPEIPKTSDTIFLISSEDATPYSLSTQLKANGYKVENASSPEAALENFDSVNPAIIISDMRFPVSKYNALDLLHVVHGNTKLKQLPFVILSAKEEIDHIKKALKNPNETVIGKPVNIEELSNVLENQLRQYQDRQNHRAAD